VTISVGTEGRAPLLAAQLRRWLEAALPPSVSALGRLLAEARQDGIRGLARRGAMLRALGDPWLARAVDLGAIDRAKERWIALNRATEEPFSPGTVAIAGAGPGGRAHLTLRALDRIQRADVIVHDALVSEEILGEAMPDARKLAMGRRAGAGGPDPALVCSLLIKEARQGHRVLRLHAGDPGVFGRGGEEVEALERAGVSCQLIPGVSAVLAAPAAAGIPLTLRGVARGFRVRTGHTKEGYRAALEPVPEEDTLVIVMGLGNAKEIFAQLIAEGRAADTPAVAVEAASCPQERVIAGTLGDLAARIEAAKLEAPVTLIVGAVAQRAREKAALEEAAA
jgi:uroporphyrin-III C-methyltransferase